MEIRRAVENGHRGVIYPSVPMELRDVPHINDSIYDPLWATCQELAVPICFHAGASSAIQIPAYEGYSPTIAAAFQAITRPASSVSVLVNLLISKILMRFPNLKVVLAESGLGWGAYLLEYTDFQATGDQLPQNGYDLMPSEMFKRQCYLVGWYDRASLRVRNYIGTENILWSSAISIGHLDLAEHPRGPGQELRGGRHQRSAKNTLGECGEAVQDSRDSKELTKRRD